MSKYYVMRADDHYIVERYVRRRRECEGPFSTSALAQARADALNNETETPTAGAKAKGEK